MKKFEFEKLKIETLGMSQKGQDSIIKYIFDSIGTTNKYYVEFGAVNGVTSCNTWYFKNIENWNGLLLDILYEDPSINLHKRYLTKENICNIFTEFSVPKEFDFLCVDIDGNDYWILSEILKQYSPRVIMVETNVRFDSYDSKVMKYNPFWKWNGYDWYGASPYSFKKMSNDFGYSPVYVHLDDMIIVKNDCLNDDDLKKDWKEVYSNPNKELYNTHIKPGHGPVLEYDLNNWIEI